MCISLCRPADFTKAIVNKLNNLGPSFAHHAVDLMMEKNWAGTKHGPASIGQVVRIARELATSGTGGNTGADANVDAN